MEWLLRYELHQYASVVLKRPENLEVMKMTNLVRWDPFTELRQTMDQLFDQGFSRPWRMLQNTEQQVGFPVDIWETDDAVEVKAALPGLRPEDVEITVANDVLLIKAEHPGGEDQPGSYRRGEIAYGTMHRAFSLPVSVDSDKAEARFEHGMLLLKLPKSEAVRPRQIRISANGGDGHLLN
jgi:HSP20 family protein